MSRAAAIASEHRIGQYKILRTLGVGGMGTVYLGEHLLLGRRAAIKTLLASLSSQREIVDRFFNEARAISAISDPGVVQIFDFGYHVDGTAYIVMEFLEGEPLSSRIERLGTLPVVDALRITRQIGASLSAAHDRGIVHRDLKPSNVYVIRDAEAQGGERTKILDFGIAKLNDDQDVQHTQRGTVLGTPVYMSPEQCRGAKSVDHRSDIYSVGCALFHMLTGRPPFVCDSVGEFLASHLREAPPAPSTLRPEIPPAVDALVLRCLAKSPDDRFQSTAALQAAADRQLAEISDSGHAVVAAPVAKTPLGQGFQSEYDVNAGNRLETSSAPPPLRSIDSHSWFVDSMSVVASSISDHYAVPRRLPLGKWLAFLAALVVGVGAGLLVTDVALSAHAANAAPVSTPIATASASPEAVWLRETRCVLEVTPPEPPPELVAAAPVAALPVHVLPARVQPARVQPARVQPVRVQPVRVQPVPVQRAKVPRPPRPHVMKPPQPRRTHSAPKPTPSEDLYDTR